MLSFLVFSLLESAMCLWIQVHPLWIQGLKRLVLLTQNLTLLEYQGLWIQATVLHCSCAKAASKSLHTTENFCRTRKRKKKGKKERENGERKR